MNTAAKMLDSGKIGGYLVVFGDANTKDLHGDYFTPRTDFALEWFDERPALYQHGLDGAVKAAPVGRIVAIKADNIGLWAEAQLDMRNRYADAVKELVKAGALSWSSGSMSHLVQRGNDGQIKRWPVVEGSLTPTPAEPRMTDIHEIKSAFEALSINFNLDLLQEPEPETMPEDGEAVGDVVEGDESILYVTEASEVKAMTEQNVDVAPANPSLKAAMQGEINELRGELKGLLDGAMTERTTAIKDSQAALEEKIARLETAVKAIPSGLGGRGEEKKATLGEYALSIKKAKTGEDRSAIKAMSGVAGGSGGFLLPQRFGMELFEMAAEESWLLPLLNVFPVNERSGKFPVAHLYGVTSAGDSPKASGASGSKRGEGASYTSTEMTVEEVEYNINNAISGEIPVTKELVKDSPISLDVILTTAITNIYRFKAEYLVFNGTGVGEPLGIFNSGALVDVTPATNNVFARADASAMAAKLWTMNQNAVRWVAHYGMMADVDALDANTYNVAAVMTAGSQRMVEFIKQYQLQYSYNVPVADSSGSMNLIDFSQYVLFQRVEAGGEGVEIDYYDQSSRTHHYWTFDARMDGQPVQRSTIAYVAPGGTSYTVSPFVRFND